MQTDRVVIAEQGAPDVMQFETVDLAAPGEGEVQVKNLFISVDPYMRGRMSGIKTYIEPFQIGAVMEGGAVGEVFYYGPQISDQARIAERCNPVRRLAKLQTVEIRAW